MVDCQLQSLVEVDFENDIDEILRNLPADLNSMYERIFERVKSKGQRAVKIVQRTLWWLVGSHRQLRLEEVMEAVMVEAGRDSLNTDLKPLSGERLLEMCSSLVRHDTESDILTLSHASVQVEHIVTAIDIRLILFARIFCSPTTSKAQRIILSTISHQCHSYTDISLAYFLRIFNMGIFRMGHVQHRKTLPSVWNSTLYMPMLL